MKRWLETLKTAVDFLALLLRAFVTLSHLEADSKANEVSSSTSICVRLGLCEHFTLFVVLHFLISESCIPFSLPSHFYIELSTRLHGLPFAICFYNLKCSKV